MSFMQRLTSFCERQQEAFELHVDARQNKPFLEEFTASDPVNGQIVKAMESKILYGSLGISAGMGLSLLANFLLHLRRKSPTMRHKIVVLSVGGASPFAAHFGVSSYLLHAEDRRRAYLEFKNWLRARD